MVEAEGGGGETVASWSKSQIKAHRRKVFCLGWNCDGSRLATGSQDQTIRLWRSDADVSPKHEAELRGHADAVMYMRWHPSHADRLASTSSQEKCLRFWDARAGKASATLATPGHNLYLAWAPDGNALAVGSREDVVAVVDVRRMEVAHKAAHRYQVNELAFLGATGLLLQGTGRGGGEVEAVRFPELRRAGALRGHTAPTLAVAVCPAARLVATGGADAVACLWDAEDLVCLRSFYSMDKPVRALAFSHDSAFLAMTGEDPCVLVEGVGGPAGAGAPAGRLPTRTPPEDCAWHPFAHVLAFPVEAGASESAVEFRARPGGSGAGA